MYLSSCFQENFCHFFVLLFKKIWLLASQLDVRKQAQDRDRKESGGIVCPKIGFALIGEEFRALLLLALEIERMGESINAISC